MVLRGSPPDEPFRQHKRQRAFQAHVLSKHARYLPKPILVDLDDLVLQGLQLVFQELARGIRKARIGFLGNSKYLAILRDPTLSGRSNLRASW